MNKNLEKTTNTDDIREQIKQVYQADVQAIKNLGDIASSMITEDGTLTLPYNVNITGDLKVDNNIQWYKKGTNYLGLLQKNTNDGANIKLKNKHNRETVLIYSLYGNKEGRIYIRDVDGVDKFTVKEDGVVGTTGNLQIDGDLTTGGNLNMDETNYIYVGNFVLGKYPDNNYTEFVIKHKDSEWWDGIRVNNEGYLKVEDDLYVGGNGLIKNKLTVGNVDIGDNLAVTGTIEARDAKFNVVSKEKAKWYSTHRHNHHNMTTRSPTY